MKRKLLFAVMTLITGALSFTARAQEDVTDTYLTNAGLSSTSGWTTGGYTAHNTQGAVNVVEFWNWSNQFNFSQTVTLPAGNYRIAVNAFYRNGGGGDGTNNNMAWIFAGSQTKNVVALNSMSDLSGYAGSNDLYRAATAFSQGKFSNEFDFDLTEESTIELGFKGTCPNSGWCILGPVKLYKYSLEDYLVDYRAKVAEAQALNEADMFPQAWNNLQAAIVDESTFSLVSEVTAAINTLSAAINAANTSISIKASAGDKLAKMKEVTEATNFYTAAAYETYYGQWQAKYDAGTITETEASGLQDPYATTGWHDNITVDDFLMSTWDAPTDFGGAYYINSWSTEDNNNGFGTPFFEYWVGSGSLAARTMTATMTGLDANQLYSVEILARTSVSGTKVDNSITMQVGSGTAVDLTTGAQLAGTRYMGTFTAIGSSDADGNLVVTLNVDGGSGISWFSWKNLKYTAIDDERIPYAEQLAQVVADAKTLSTTLVVPAGVASVLYDAADTYEGYTYTSLATVADFQAAIAEVNAAIATAQDAEATYANYQTLHGYAETLLATDYVDLVADAHATYAAAVTEPTLNTKADIDQAYDDLYAATMTYVADADPAAGAAFDLTFMLVNPDVTSFWDGTWGIVPAGWYTDQNPADNFQVMSNNEMGPGGEVFIEYWSGTAKSSNFVLYQKATLPEGTYQMTGRVGLLQADGYGTTANMTFSANDTDGSQIAVGSLADQSVEFINTTNQEVKIGLKAHTGNNYRWIGINKIKLYKVPTDNTEYAIGVDATNATVDVTVEGVAAAAAKKLDAVNYTITLDASCTLETHTVTYVDGDNNTQTITPTDLGEGQYTFQMPAFDVTITVTATLDKSALAAALAGAAPYLNEALPAAIMTALNSANTTAQDVYDDADATAAQVSAATDALNFAVLDVQNALVPYQAYLELKPYADALVLVDNDNTTANTALAEAISDAEDAVDAAASADDINNANEALRTAMDTYAAAANPVGDGAKFNLTYKFVNPNLEGLPTWQSCDGWYTEQPDGNSQVMTNDAATSEDGTKTAFYEYWSYTAKSNNLFTLYQPVTLPAGYYEMSCYAFAKQQDDPANTGDVKGVFFYANDTQGTVVDTDRLSQKSIEFKNRTAQEVKIGLKAINPNSYNWMGIGYLELYKIPSKTLIIDQDDDEYDITKAGAYDVTLLRPIKAAYNTLVLPFSMTQQEIEDAFGQDSKVSYLKGYNAAANALSFTSKNDAGEPLGLIANRPCLLKATEPIDEGTPIEIEGRTVIASENDLPAYNVLTRNANDEIIGEATMYGTYQGEINVPDYCWFVQGGQLVYAPGNNTHCWINMTRAYIELKDGEGNSWTPDPSGVKALTITFDDEEATGIAVVENGALKVLDGQAYDLSGRAVKNPTKGLYIINGQKVFLK